MKNLVISRNKRVRMLTEIEQPYQLKPKLISI